MGHNHHTAIIRQIKIETKRRWIAPSWTEGKPDDGIIYITLTKQEKTVILFGPLALDLKVLTIL